MIALSPPPLLLAAAALTMQTVVPRVASLQIHPSLPPRAPSGGRPLRAYAAAAAEGRGNRDDPWRSLRNFPHSFFEAQDWMLSLEGPLGVPNHKTETTAVPDDDMGTLDAEKEGLVAELASLARTFDDLRSSMDRKSKLHLATVEGYEAKIGILEETNALLRGKVDVLTLALERQEEQTKGLLREENEALKRRVRLLEGELSDLAFESRRGGATTTATTADPSSAKPTDDAASGAAASASPVPPHIYQQRRLEEYQRERSRVRTSFGRGIRRALNRWSPAYNLALWGELKGQGNAAM